jgi:serine protease Do
VVVQPLDEAARQEAGGRGVLVTEVAGAAARAGIRPGDVILAVNSAVVQSPADLKRLVSSANDRIALLVHRDDAEIFVPVTLG